MKYLSRLYLALLMLWLPGGAMAAPPLLSPEGHMQQLTIYAAKGPPDSCGPGCDRWIAIEGKIEPGSAARVERFFRDRKDNRRPIYFNSLGGELRDALSIGRLLRSRKAIGRVGRTFVDACPGTQTDDACALIKTVRDEVVGSVTTRDAVCGSACKLLLFGAVTREVAPDAAVAVHGPKVWMEFRVNINEKRREEAIDKARNEGLRLATAYVEEMGVSREIMTLAASISHESHHFLTRQELYRFRIDTRDFVEAPWTLDRTKRPSVRKVAQIRDGESFRKLEWQFVCDSAGQARLVFVDEVGNSAAANRILAMTAGSARPPQFSRFPARLGAYEAWFAVITPDAMKNIFAAPSLEMAQSALLPDGKATTPLFVTIQTRGLEAEWTRLSAICLKAQAKPMGAKWPSPPVLPPPLSQAVRGAPPPASTK